MTRVSDEQIAATIEQWEQHDKFRDFLNEGEPLEVRLAKYVHCLHAQLTALREKWREEAVKWRRQCDEVENTGTEDFGSAHGQWMAYLDAADELDAILAQTGGES